MRIKLAELIKRIFQKRIAQWIGTFICKTIKVNECDLSHSLLCLRECTIYDCIRFKCYGTHCFLMASVTTNFRATKSVSRPHWIHRFYICDVMHRTCNCINWNNNTLTYYRSLFSATFVFSWQKRMEKQGTVVAWLLKVAYSDWTGLFFVLWCDIYPIQFWLDLQYLGSSEETNCVFTLSITPKLDSSRF